MTSQKCSKIEAFEAMLRTATAKPVIETRLCKSCDKERPIEEFRVSRRAGKITYFRGTCIECQARLVARQKFKERWRKNWHTKSQEIPQRAILRFLQENPYAMQKLFELYPNQIANYMKAEKVVVFNEILDESKRYGDNRRKYPEINKQIIDELRVEFFT